MQGLHTNSKAAKSVWTTEISELSAKMSIEELLKKWKEAAEEERFKMHGSGFFGHGYTPFPSSVIGFHVCVDRL